MTAKPDLQPLVHGLGASCTNSKFKFLSDKMFHPLPPQPTPPPQGSDQPVIIF